MTLFRANNKRSYLAGTINDAVTQMDLVHTDYGADSSKDRNIPEDVSNTIRLVLWEQQFSNPGIDPNREIVEAVWSGSGHVFNITRGMEATTAGSHYIGDNVALLFTTDMSWEPCVFKYMLDETIGSIGFTEDLDASGDAEVEKLVPDNEISVPEGYKKVLVTGGTNTSDPRPFWDFVFESPGSDRL